MALIEKARDEEERRRLEVQLKNKVKKCGVCGKPNGFTLKNCNGCSNDLTKTEISFTNNVFSSFLLGISKGPFPFLISIRKQSPEFLVVDDLLSLTRLHLNVIPASSYIPDWLVLLHDPKRGLALINQMFEECWSVVESSFWPHRHHLFQGELSLETLRGHVAAGFNYPPSQYQLHMQFIVPPFMPFHWLACKKGIHFTKGRFFPLEYLQAVLQCPTQFSWTDASSMEELFDFYKTHHNVDYDEIHERAVKRYYASHEALCNWNEADFKGVVTEDSSFVPFIDGQLAVEKAELVDSVDKVAADDKMILQNYGRPYDQNGKPTGTYYKYARESLDFFKEK